MDLQLPVQSVFITTSVVSSNPAQARCTRDVLDTTQYVMYLFVSDLRQVSGFLRVSSINKTDFHDVTEILLKVLNIITLILTLHIYSSLLLDNCHYFIETSRNKQSFNLTKTVSILVEVNYQTFFLQCVWFIIKTDDVITVCLRYFVFFNTKFKFLNYFQMTTIVDFSISHYSGRDTGYP